MDVTTPLIISDDRTVTDLRVTTTGSLKITGEVTVTADNFILESNGATASGQFVAGSELLNYAHAYFDYKVNVKTHQWYPVAVPWPVDAETGISVNGRVLELGVDFDVIYYNGALRAEVGKQKCWSYVENDGDKTLVPGRLYLIGLMLDAPTIRFAKKTGSALLTTTTSVEQYDTQTGDTNDRGWNGVANPALFHAFVNPGVAYGQIYKPDTWDYDPITLSDGKLVVGQGAFVQVDAGKSITVTQGGAFAAPRREKEEAAIRYDVRIAPEEANYTSRLYVEATDEKEVDAYIIGQDLSKVDVSTKVAQIWVNRYGEKLCVNTQELTDEMATYPLGIRIPTSGEYTLSVAASDENSSLYLTRNGRVIWDLNAAPYSAWMEEGTNEQYGLLLVSMAPGETQDIDAAIVDAQGETRKVLIDNKVYIIRCDKAYTVEGQLVK
jgi:hypothetical protein